MDARCRNLWPMWDPEDGSLLFVSDRESKGASDIQAVIDEVLRRVFATLTQAQPQPVANAG